MSVCRQSMGKHDHRPEQADRDRTADLRREWRSAATRHRRARRGPRRARRGDRPQRAAGMTFRSIANANASRRRAVPGRSRRPTPTRSTGPPRTPDPRERPLWPELELSRQPRYVGSATGSTGSKAMRGPVLFRSLGHAVAPLRPPADRRGRPIAARSRCQHEWRLATASRVGVSYSNRVRSNRIDITADRSPARPGPIPRDDRERETRRHQRE